MLEPTYRAAVIGRSGRGNYGHGLDIAFLSHPRLNLVAVADDDPAGLAAAKQRLRVDHAYADFRVMLAREKPHFVAVAPRWMDCHRDMVLASAEAGALGILCEKPLAPTIADCDAIVDACHRHHAKLAIAFQTRYSPRFQRVQELLLAGAIGEILEVRGRGKEDQRGGGEDLMVLGTHTMNAASALLGSPRWCFARVSQQGVPVSAVDVRQGAEGIGPLAGDRVDAVYGFHGTPALFHFATSRPTQGKSQRYGLWIYGSTGLIQMGFGWRPPAWLLAEPSWMPTAKVDWVEITSAGIGKEEALPRDSLDDGNVAIVADLVQAVEQDRPPRASAEDGRTAIEMILACYDSHRAGTPVTLPLEKRSTHPLQTWNH